MTPQASISIHELQLPTIQLQWILMNVHRLIIIWRHIDLWEQYLYESRSPQAWAYIGGYILDHMFSEPDLCLSIAPLRQHASC